ncbi:MAG: response regulator [Bacteroidales bacterium]|nr:response regulator [Bacteroidales bacterium]
MLPSTIEIILVEDNLSDAEMTLDALKRKNLGNILRVIEDGAEALDYFFNRGDYSDKKASNNPKLILIDLKLPKVSGLEVLRELKSNKKTKNIPVVILTSSSEDSNIKTAYELGANSFIVKPVDFDQFCKAVGDIGLYWMLFNEPPK